jgi:2-keto-4-pentenoate hydratase/2-oxohepta-3-ene-1,7-dioic acid hydratase in catechol pathway
MVQVADYRPLDSLAGPLEDIPIDRESKLLDYEGELCVIIGKTCKNLDRSDQDPLDFVLGYTVGNDVSARHWQNAQLSGGQHGYAKAFDKFAPIGPSIVSTSVIPDPSKLRLTTKVNGELRQETGTDDLLFDIRTVIRHMSRGKTIRPGTVIMTGTPSGVGWFMEPSGLLKDGDIVEVEIDQIGVIKNRMVFEA